ncbi:hydroxyacid dehydrogenase [Desulfoscipio geothermicus]|jgi:D-3-phosphoglycerate dehydrogenase/(S)-sulfolactate dehydrogenase|uniref:2-oxoglutarate reductase n=1 Tax=Desulfoscipio geothermicus DSM 3669 TaxID=1121426 RepID=A0A1I6DW19_9FIRM|nr:hydroxyacid dehydrogenase [Desulfoscipio geothermicus]SFR09635.1 (S)-sulfolactate dehydrogenase [Desulfoscipio geothermicus DSM 3669]
MKTVITELNWKQGNEILSEMGEVIYDPELWRKKELPDIIHDAEALIVRNQTKVSRTLLDSAPKLRVIGRLGVGLDNIDLQATKDKGISVVYARNANAISVVEYVFAVMLTFARHPVEATTDVKRGNWNRKLFTGSELYGKTLGLIGIGEIGTRLAARAKAFGMHLLGYDPFLPPYEIAIADFGVEQANLEGVIRRADFISLHVPLNKATRHLINKQTLELVKSTAYIINSARGGVIDEQALYEALSNKKIAGAALDVLEQEPPTNSPLLKLDNVILTPHIAGLTEEAQVKTSVLVAREVIKVFQGQQSSCVVIL